MLARSEDSGGRRKRAGEAQSLASEMESEQKAAVENIPAQHARQAQAATHGAWPEEVLGDCGSSLSTITYGFKCDQEWDSCGSEMV